MWVNTPYILADSTIRIYIYYIWLVVYLPLWKIWKSNGMMIFATEWKNIKCSTPPTRNVDNSREKHSTFIISFRKTSSYELYLGECGKNSFCMFLFYKEIWSFEAWHGVAFQVGHPMASVRLSLVGSMKIRKAYSQNKLCLPCSWTTVHSCAARKNPALLDWFG
jgi:hypothetical protein